MRVCEYESDYKNRGFFPIKELIIVFIVIAMGVFVWYKTGYVPKAKVDNTEYVVVIETRLSYNEQLRSILRQLLKDKNGEERFDELGKYKILHDFVTKAIKYENAALAPGVNLAFGQGYNDPAKALNTGKGVCGAYAQLYKDLCDLAGLNCEFVYGDAFIPGNTGISGHAWNLVRIAGEYYHLDCCWSDTGGGLYDYYMRGERFIQVGDGGNFREMKSTGFTVSDKDYKFDRSQNYANIIIQRK